MAELLDSLWRYNLARVVVIDVSDDYRLMKPPLPSSCYPVLQELWMPVHNLRSRLPGADLVEGYLYDWHQSPAEEQDVWFVGVVHMDLVEQLLAESGRVSA